MKIINQKLFTILTFALTASIASAANTLISGDLAVGTNWDTGAPTTVGNIGIIDSANASPNNGLFTGTVTGLFIEQTGGRVSGSGNTQTLSSTQYELVDGVFGINSLDVQGGSVFTVCGGTANFGGTGNARNLSITTSGTVSVSEGSVSVSQDLVINSTGLAAAKVFDFSGGTINVTRHAMTGFQGVGTANFSGDVAFTVGNTFGTNQVGNRLVNIGLGTGSITTATFEARNMFIDWTANTGFEITATTLLSAGVATTWEALWTSGNLKVNGGNLGAFSDHFEVTGNTLAAVPEPSAALLGGLGLLALLRRRRSE